VKAIITTPKLLKGYTLDGKVFLYWENLFAENQNLEGYKVFRKNKANNSSNENFVALFDSLLSPKQNNYVDTSCIAGNDYEYTVKSYDISGAESEYSPYIEITLPTDPVLPPSGLTITNRDNGILIQWDPLISNKIKNVKIFRYERGSEPIQIGNVNADEFQFLDTSTIKDNLYFYFIISVDNYGSESNRSEELGIRRL
jgi:fibronectin type 3 domain-containing protein